MTDPSDFTLTIWRNGDTLSAQIECPAFVDRQDDLADFDDAWGWAEARQDHVPDPFKADE